jgi:hypothetical protein
MVKKLSTLLCLACLGAAMPPLPTVPKKAVPVNAKQSYALMTPAAAVKPVRPLTLIRKCRIAGISDGFYLDSTNASFGIVDQCIFDSAWDGFTIPQLASSNHNWVIQNSTFYNTNWLYHPAGTITKRGIQCASGTIAVDNCRFVYGNNDPTMGGPGLMAALHADEPGVIYAQGIDFNPVGTNSTDEIQAGGNNDAINLYLGSYSLVGTNTLRISTTSQPIISGPTHFGDFQLQTALKYNQGVSEIVNFGSWHWRDAGTTNGACVFTNENNAASTVANFVTLTPQNDNLGDTNGSFSIPANWFYKGSGFGISNLTSANLNFVWFTNKVLASSSALSLTNSCPFSPSKVFTYLYCVTNDGTTGWRVGDWQSIEFIDASAINFAVLPGSEAQSFGILINGTNVILQARIAFTNSGYAGLYLTPRTGGDPISVVTNANFEFIMQCFQ